MRIPLPYPIDRFDHRFDDANTLPHQLPHTGCLVGCPTQGVYQASYENCWLQQLQPLIAFCSYRKVDILQPLP